MIYVEVFTIYTCDHKTGQERKGRRWGYDSFFVSCVVPNREANRQDLPRKVLASMYI